MWGGLLFVLLVHSENVNWGCIGWKSCLNLGDLLLGCYTQWLFAIEILVLNRLLLRGLIYSSCVPLHRAVPNMAASLPHSRGSERQDINMEAEISFLTEPHKRLITAFLPYSVSHIGHSWFSVAKDQARVYSMVEVTESHRGGWLP